MTWMNRLAKGGSICCSGRWIRIGFACAVLLPGICTRAQEQVPEAPGAAATSSLSSPKPQHVPFYQYMPTNLQTGRLLRSTKSPLQWRRWSLLSFETVSAYVSNSQRSGTAHSSSISGMRGLFVYSHRREKMSLDLQYLPSLWVSSGQLFISDSLNLSGSRHLSGRWILGFSDHLDLKANREQLFESIFSSDPSTGGIDQQPYLDAEKRHFTNTAEISAAYLLSPRSNLDFRFEHSMAQVSDPSSPNGISLQDLAAGNRKRQEEILAGIGWAHLGSPTQQFGVGYDYGRRRSTSGDVGSVQFHTLSFSYSRQIRPSLRLQTMIGPGLRQNKALFGTRIVRDQSLTYEGSLSLNKTLAKSELAFALSRSNKFTGLISNDLNDRLDVSYSRQLNWRWRMTLEAGYVRQHFSQRPSATGRVGLVRMDYRLNPKWSIHMSYFYLAERAVSQTSGPRHLITGGLRWTPVRESRTTAQNQ